MPPNLEPASAFASLTLRFLGKEREFSSFDGRLFGAVVNEVGDSRLCVELSIGEASGDPIAEFVGHRAIAETQQEALDSLERALVPLADDLSCLIEADRAAVREPLEKELELMGGELDMAREEVKHCRERIASLEAQLATAREEALREAVAALRAEADPSVAAAQEAAGRGDQVARLDHLACAATVRACATVVEALLTSPPKSPSPGTCRWVATGERAPTVSGHYDVLLEEGLRWKRFFSVPQQSAPGYMFGWRGKPPAFWLEVSLPELPPPAAQKEPSK